MQYMILSEDDVTSITKVVQNALNKGWELQGGIAVSYDPRLGVNGHHYHQAIIKRDKMLTEQS